LPSADDPARIAADQSIDGSVENAYAPRARVAGAIATLRQLRGGAVGMRILNELWAADAVDSNTAVWLINCVLQDSSSQRDETEQAAELLVSNVRRLVPTVDDSDQEWELWPRALTESWPTTLSYNTRGWLVVAATQMLLAREISWWEMGSVYTPVMGLVSALDDRDYGPTAARVLSALLDADALNEIGFPADDELVIRIRRLSALAEITPWFDRLITQFAHWVRGESIQASPFDTVLPTAQQPRSDGGKAKVTKQGTKVRRSQKYNT
jgi:hypothetical protein